MKISELNARIAVLTERYLSEHDWTNADATEKTELLTLQTAYIHGAYIGVRPDLSGFGYEFSFQDAQGRERIKRCDKVGYLAGYALDVMHLPVVIEEGLPRWRENLVTRLERYGVQALEED